MSSLVQRKEAWWWSRARTRQELARGRAPCPTGRCSNNLSPSSPCSCRKQGRRSSSTWRSGESAATISVERCGFTTRRRLQRPTGRRKEKDTTSRSPSDTFNRKLCEYLPFISMKLPNVMPLFSFKTSKPLNPALMRKLYKKWRKYGKLAQMHPNNQN